MTWFLAGFATAWLMATAYVGWMEHEGWIQKGPGPKN